MPTTVPTYAVLSALAYLAGRPETREPAALVLLDLVGELARAVEKPAGGTGRDLFELTDAGRQLLDERSPRTAGWGTPHLKDLGDGRHWKSTRYAPKRHHFAGRTGDPMVSACGGWKIGAGRWDGPAWQRLDPETNPATDCARCRRELVRAGQ